MKACWGMDSHAVSMDHLYQFYNHKRESYLWSSQVAPVVKSLLANAGDVRDVGLIPGSGRSPGEGTGNPLQHSCLENPMDRGAWRAIVHRVVKSQTWLKQLKRTACKSLMNITLTKWSKSSLTQSAAGQATLCPPVGVPRRVQHYVFRAPTRVHHLI